MSLLSKSIRSFITVITAGVLVASVWFKYTAGVDIPAVVAVAVGLVWGYWLAGDVEFSTPLFSFSASEDDMNDSTEESR